MRRELAVAWQAAVVLSRIAWGVAPFWYGSLRGALAELRRIADQP